MLSKPNKQLVDAGLQEAIHCLLKRDYYLLENDVNERSISHRLGQYLQEIFTDWYVDCEYNRNHDNLKTLNLPTKKSVTINDTEAYTVYPDIIVHIRGTDQNLLVIEIKKTSSTETSDWDSKKLKAFKHELGYYYAVALLLRTGCNNCGVESIEYIED